MKKIFGYLLGFILIIVAVNAFCPEVGAVLKKHIPVVGNEVVTMAEDIAGTGLEQAGVQVEDRETANRIIHDVCDFIHVGFDYYATEDEALKDRVTADFNDLVALGGEELAELISRDWFEIL